MTLIQNYAITYAALGFKILPLGIEAKQPHKSLAPRGLHSATDDIEAITEWFNRQPKINIGIACKPSNLVVLDVDLRNGGTTDGLTKTRRIRTGNGWHYYYYASSGMSFPGKYREGVDIKWNGYVVAAPSVHPSGSIYQVDDLTEIRPISDLVGV